jgi:uncharacterized peroxidase-related enzyme
LTGSADLSRALARDSAAAEVSPADVEMLSYAVKLTRTPSAVGGDDIERLREMGFDDTALLDICQVVSYYNYVNRLADGLGVELEDYWKDEELTMDRNEFEVAVKRRRAVGYGETK